MPSCKYRGSDDHSTHLGNIQEPPKKGARYIRSPGPECAIDLGSMQGATIGGSEVGSVQTLSMPKGKDRSCAACHTCEKAARLGPYGTSSRILLNTRVLYANPTWEHYLQIHYIQDVEWGFALTGWCWAVFEFRLLQARHGRLQNSSVSCSRAESGVYIIIYSFSEAALSQAFCIQVIQPKLPHITHIHIHIHPSPHHRPNPHPHHRQPPPHSSTPLSPSAPTPAPSSFPVASSPMPDNLFHSRSPHFQQIHQPKLFS